MQTLADLVATVALAFSWDLDRPWSLTLSAEFDQETFYLSSESDGRRDAPIGTLGMPVGHRFELLYDPRRRHRVELERIDAPPAPKPRAKYPRVAASVGKTASR